MLHVETKYTVSASPDPEIGRREFKNLLKEAWSAVGWRHFELAVARHFTKEGGREYGYKPRVGEQSGLTQAEFWRSYAGQKLKATGQTDPLVFSGRTREGARRATIYPTSGGVRVTLPGCVHINQFKPPARRDGRPPIDIREELLTISPAEADDRARFHGAAFVKAYTAARASRQIRIT